MPDDNESYIISEYAMHNEVFQYALVPGGLGDILKMCTKYNMLYDPANNTVKFKAVQTNKNSHWGQATYIEAHPGDYLIIGMNGTVQNTISEQELKEGYYEISKPTSKFSI